MLGGIVLDKLQNLTADEAVEFLFARCFKWSASSGDTALSTKLQSQLVVGLLLGCHKHHGQLGFIENGGNEVFFLIHVNRGMVYAILRSLRATSTASWLRHIYYNCIGIVVALWGTLIVVLLRGVF